MRSLKRESSDKKDKIARQLLIDLRLQLDSQVAVHIPTVNQIVILKKLWSKEFQDHSHGLLLSLT